MKLSQNGKLKHTHQYQKMPYGSKGHEIFKCMTAGCSHFMPQKELAIGRMHICWGCSKEMQITQEHMSKKRPKCNYCIENNAARLTRMANIPIYDPLLNRDNLEQDEIDFQLLLKGES